MILKRFALSDGQDHVEVQCDPRNEVNLDPSDGKVSTLYSYK